MRLFLKKFFRKQKNRRWYIKTVALFLALLLSVSIVFLDYMESYAMGEGVLIYTGAQITGTILAALGIGAAVDVATRPKAYTKWLDETFNELYGFAQGYNEWASETESAINKKLDSWFESWKKGAITLSDEAMNFFKAFATLKYNNSSNIDSGFNPGLGISLPSTVPYCPPGVPPKSFYFQAGYPVGAFVSVSRGTKYYVYRHYMYADCPLYAFTYFDLDLGYRQLVVMPADSGKFRTFERFGDDMNIGTESPYKWDSIKQYGAEIQKLPVPENQNTSISDTKVYNFEKVDSLLLGGGILLYNNIIDIGNCDNIVSALIAFGKDGSGLVPDVLLPNIQELAPDIPNLIERDGDLSNYDVISNTGTITDTGVIEGDRTIVAVGTDVLEKLMTGEITWEQFMKMTNSVAIDTIDGITVDTPILSGSDSDEGGKLGDVYNGGGSDIDSPNEVFIADLKRLFPFCVPFDLIRAVKLLSAEPVAPVFTIPFDVDFHAIQVHEKWEIDMGEYDSVVKIFRILETLGFCVSLIMVTRNLIKG